MQGLRVRLPYIFLLGIVSTVMHCATPVSPSGGPVDSEPPQLVKTEPLNETVSFSGDRFEIHFNEYLNTASFASSFSISPKPEEGFELKWKGKKLEVLFEGELRDSTTYILTIDKSLKDLHGVALSRPITLAFSTGIKIDSGRLAGEVLDPATGKPVVNMDVLAFGRNPNGSLTEKALYRTQVDEQGRFALSYLPTRDFVVVGVVDRNRNSELDDDEEVAISTLPMYTPSTDSLIVPKVELWSGRVDTQAPRLLRVRAEGARTYRLEFSESVILDPDSLESWVLRDSLSSMVKEIRAGYRSATNPDQVLFQVGDSLMATHFLDIAAVSDSLGNVVDSMSIVIRPTTKALGRPSFVAFTSVGPSFKQDSILVLGPGSTPAFSYKGWLARDAVKSSRDSTVLTEGNWKRENNGVLALDGVNIAELSKLSLAGSAFGQDTTYHTYYRTMSESDMGSVSGFVNISGSTIVEFYQAQWGDVPIAVAKVDSTDFLLENLPKGAYSMRIVKDADQNGRWSPGQLMPFIAPEPVRWLNDSLLVQSRFETVIDTVESW